MNNPSQPGEPRRLDAQAIDVLREVANEFAFFNSAVKGKTDAERGGASASGAITTMLADAVDRLESGTTTLMEKPRQRADAFAAHLVWKSRDTNLLHSRMS